PSGHLWNLAGPGPGGDQRLFDGGSRADAGTNETLEPIYAARLGDGCLFPITTPSRTQSSIGRASLRRVAAFRCGVRSPGLVGAAIGLVIRNARSMNSQIEAVAIVVLLIAAFLIMALFLMPLLFAGLKGMIPWSPLFFAWLEPIVFWI